MIWLLDIEDVVMRIIIVGVILTFRTLTQEALEVVSSVTQFSASVVLFFEC